MTAALVVSAVWIWLATRTLHVSDDTGTFVSVADRLRNGERLYEEVWDNKDPYFYYLLAIGRSLTPYAEYLLELMWLVVASAASVAAAFKLGLRGPLAWFVGGVAVPVVLTGSVYQAGLAHLPGIAITLVAIAAALWGKWGTAGALLGILLFLKMTMVPVALTVLAVLWWRDRGSSNLARLVSGAAITSIGGLVLLWARGELQPYIASLFSNASYSQGAVLVSEYGPVFAHLRRTFPELGPAHGEVVLAALVLALVIVFAGSAVDVHAVTVARCVIAATVSSLVVLAVSGIWEHHAQVLYIGAALTMLGLGRIAATRFNALTAVVVTLLAAYLLGGVVHPYVVAGSFSGIKARFAEMAAPSAVSRLLMSLSPEGTYARVGTNDTGRHAVGLTGWHLACPRFHQYPFEGEPVLSEVLTCLPRASVIVVDPSAVPDPSYPAWNAFLTEVEALLAREYVCTAPSEVRVCVRQGARL